MIVSNHRGWDRAARRAERPGAATRPGPIVPGYSGLARAPSRSPGRVRDGRRPRPGPLRAAALPARKDIREHRALDEPPRRVLGLARSATPTITRWASRFGLRARESAQEELALRTRRMTAMRRSLRVACRGSRKPRQLRVSARTLEGCSGSGPLERTRLVARGDFRLLFSAEGAESVSGLDSRGR
jgi:hypothetical protein